MERFLLVDMRVFALRAIQNKFQNRKKRKTKLIVICKNKYGRFYVR